MELAVYGIDGKKTSKKVKLNQDIFGIEPNDHAIYLDVKQHRANVRQGTHKAKERAEITGSTRKIKKQKGTGTARAGSIKSPLFRGGGRVFGPRPRFHGFKLNKKLKELARKSAWSYKLKDEGLTIVEDFSFDAPKTKEFQAILDNLKVEGRSLVVINETNKNVYLSSRNIKNSELKSVNDLNTYEILKATKVILSESSFKELENTFTSK